VLLSPVNYMNRDEGRWCRDDALGYLFQHGLSFYNFPLKLDEYCTPLWSGFVAG